MANLFIKQAKQYAQARPSYTPQLFQFIASKTPHHDLVWDVGTGSGQAARSLAEIYNNVIATDTSPKQLEFATKLPNIRYQETSPTMSPFRGRAESGGRIERGFSDRGSSHALVRPPRVLPTVNESVDKVLKRFYENPYWDPQRRLVDDKYKSIDFPFEAVDGEDNTGPFELGKREKDEFGGVFDVLEVMVGVPEGQGEGGGAFERGCGGGLQACLGRRCS
ncbi:hypothetical protein V6N12_005513 [Hibiscus sabdariffa]|uniref:Methyltransferase type 11 domain-containing protein n=1 Tax=Hibiscus sabdariffa TaxID=183260 RepID=A0ABR2B6K5_9ROSI